MGAPSCRFGLAFFALPLALPGCAAQTGVSKAVVTPAAAETISYEVGPCFGFCPVYTAAVNSKGEVAFDGLRHTAALGSKSVNIGAEGYRAFASALAPFRPAPGADASTTCDARISDQQHYRIVWTAPDGTRSTLEHDRGCRSSRNDVLNAILQSAPDRLGIADYTRQITRPGVSRG